LDIVYSRALFSESTPSASRPGFEDKNLGLEFDAKLFYVSEDGFTAWMQYGMFIPMRGLNARAVDRTELDAKLAHTIQAMMAITF
jgi:hypothetical protein